MGETDFGILLDARGHVRIKKHVPGRIRLRFSPDILRATPRLQSAEGRATLSAIPGIEDVGVNPLTFTVTVSYDRTRIPPTYWERLVDGSDEKARKVVEELRDLASG